MIRNTLWTFGCSFTAEYPLENPNLRTKYDDYKDWRGGDLPKSWPNLLSEMIDYNVKNFGEGGSSNQSIFWKFIEEHKNFKKGDLIIIGWTSILRFAAYNERDNCMNNMLPTYINTNVEHIFSDQALTEIFNNRSNAEWCVELCRWISLINSFCKLSEIKVLHWSSDSFFFEKYTDKYDFDSFIRTPDGDLNVFEFSRMLYSDGKRSIKDETFGEIMDLHNGEFGHLSQARYFYEFIKTIDGEI